MGLKCHQGYLQNILAFNLASKGFCGGTYFGLLLESGSGTVQGMPVARGISMWRLFSDSSEAPYSFSLSWAFIFWRLLYYL